MGNTVSDALADITEDGNVFRSDRCETPLETEDWEKLPDLWVAPLATLGRLSPFPAAVGASGSRPADGEEAETCADARKGWHKGADGQGWAQGASHPSKEAAERAQKRLTKAGRRSEELLQPDPDQVVLRPGGGNDHRDRNVRAGWVPLRDVMQLQNRVLLTQLRIRELYPFLPLATRFASCWKLIYCPRIHGVSLRTFYRQCQTWPSSTLVIVEDTQGAVFGGFASSQWKLTQDKKHFGEPESFVFTFKKELDDTSRSSSKESVGSDLKQAVADPRRLSRFDPQKMGSNICLSKDGILASHTDKHGNNLGGIVFGDARIPLFSEGAYFEVRVNRIRRGHEDGLTLGIATALPSGELPQVADEMPNSWSIGYDGNAHTDGCRRMVSIDWHPRDLRVNDHIGLLVTRFREMYIIENGDVVAQVPCDVSLDLPLFAFIDLLGNTAAVSLLPHAKPPEFFDYGVPTPWAEEGRTLRVFPWAGGNHFFMYADMDGFSMGGGAGVAWWTAGDFLHGSSGQNQTYGTDGSLASSSEFAIRNFECWAFEGPNIGPIEDKGQKGDTGKRTSQSWTSLRQDVFGKNLRDEAVDMMSTDHSFYRRSSLSLG